MTSISNPNPPKVDVCKTSKSVLSFLTSAAAASDSPVVAWVGFRFRAGATVRHRFDLRSWGYLG